MSQFPTTRWSVVLAARAGSRLALAQLLGDYWQALYVFARRSGSSGADAEDRTQGYFLHFVEKGFVGSVDADSGRFRAFLLASFKHYLANDRDRSSTRKRGGDKLHLSLDFAAADALYREARVDGLTAEQLYDRRWGLTVMKRALERLEEEEVQAGRAERFAELRRFLTGDDEGLARGGAALGLGAAAMKVAVHRLRRRYGDCLRAEVSDTAAEGADLEGELRALFQAVAQPALAEWS